MQFADVACALKTQTAIFFLLRAKEMQDPQRSLRIQCKSSRSRRDKELVSCIPSFHWRYGKKMWSF